MRNNFLQNGFYVSEIADSYTYTHRGEMQKIGNKFRRINQKFSMEYDFTVLAIDNKVDDNTKGLIEIVNKTPVENFVFSGLNSVSPKTFHDFYRELCEAGNFDFSKKYSSVIPNHLKKYLDRITEDKYDERLGIAMTPHIFKLIEVETDINSTEIKLNDWVNFSSNGINFIIKKLIINLISKGIAQYERNAENDW